MGFCEFQAVKFSQSWEIHRCTRKRRGPTRNRHTSGRGSPPDRSIRLCACGKLGTADWYNERLNETKGYVHKSVRPWSLNCSIVPVFLSLFAVSFQNISPFSNRIRPKLFETLAGATESNAQRNKLSLQATTSSGISHFRKTHLKRREVVMTWLWSQSFQRFTIWLLQTDLY